MTKYCRVHKRMFYSHSYVNNAGRVMDVYQCDVCTGKYLEMQ